MNRAELRDFKVELSNKLEDLEGFSTMLKQAHEEGAPIIFKETAEQLERLYQFVIDFINEPNTDPDCWLHPNTGQPYAIL